MKRNSALLLAASAGILGAGFFLDEPTPKQRVMTEFDVMNLEAARQKRERRRFKKQQAGVLAKEVEKPKADVLLVGPGSSASQEVVKALSHPPQPVVLVVDHQPPATLLEALASLHRSTH